MRCSEDCNGKTVFFTCGDTQAETARFFVDILRREDAAHGVIRDDGTIQVGWGLYGFEQVDDAYVVVTCDLRGRGATEDLTDSLRIFARQCRALRTAGVPPTETRAQDTLVVRRAALGAARVYMQRCEPAGPGDSGWYMGQIGGGREEDTSACVRMFTSQLIGFCEEALSVIQFPVGTLCVFSDGRLVEAVDGGCSEAGAEHRFYI